MTWSPGQPQRRLAGTLRDGFDSQQRVLITGVLSNGTDIIVRLLASRDTTHVRVHVQSSSGSAGIYDDAGDEGGIGVVDFRADKIQDVTVSGLLDTPVRLWAIPVRYESGAEIRYDGVAAPDYMSFTQLPAA